MVSARLSTVKVLTFIYTLALSTLLLDLPLPVAAGKLRRAGAVCRPRPTASTSSSAVAAANTTTTNPEQLNQNALANNPGSTLTNALTSSTTTSSKHGGHKSKTSYSTAVTPSVSLSTSVGWSGATASYSASLTVSASSSAATASATSGSSLDGSSNAIGTSSTPSDVYRHRAQSGVNLGSWFVAEAWMSPNYYSCATSGSNGKQSEVDIAAGCSQSTMENHWNTWITESDFAALAAQGINTVRIPFGYWTVGQANCNCQNTAYWPYMSKYANSWSYVMKAIDWAAANNIGVLLDYHGAHGSQNGLDHSGIDTGPAFPSDGGCQTNSVAVLTWVAQQVKDKTNMVGIELLNEPFNLSPSQIGSFYQKAIKGIQGVAGSDFPIYIFGDNDQWSSWIKSQSGFMVQDYHSYYVYSAQDLAMTTDQLASYIKSTTAATLKSWSTGGNLVIGEWGCAVAPGAQENSGVTSQYSYCDAQATLYNTLPGQYYWSLRTEGGYSPWDWTSATARQGGSSRALVVPANGASSFARTSSAPSFSGSKRRRGRYGQPVRHVHHSADWKAGYETAKRFAAYDSRLGFVHQWLSTVIRKRDEESGTTTDVEAFQAGLQAYLG